jgi:hypothetical protein
MGKRLVTASPSLLLLLASAALAWSAALAGRADFLRAAPVGSLEANSAQLLHAGGHRRGRATCCWVSPGGATP